MRRKAAIDAESDRIEPDYSKVKIPLPRRKEIFWRLLDICRSLNTAVEFDITEMNSISCCTRGEFDSSKNHITVLKPLALKDDIDLRTLWVFAHECRHAQQFNQRLKPDAWLFYVGVIFTQPDADCVWLENDADDWASDFIGQQLTKKERDKVTFDE